MNNKDLLENFKKIMDDLYPLEPGIDPVWEAFKAGIKYCKDND